MTTSAPDRATLLARGVLQEVIAATATKPGAIVLQLPTSSYQIHLRPSAPLESFAAGVGKRLVGTITVQALRVDVVKTGGGRFVEPVFGRPRRVQGSVLTTDPASGTITVNAGGGAAVDSGTLPIVIKLTDPRNKPADYQIGDLVCCDVFDGATFQNA